jgi:hypothetical protein
MKAIGLTQYSRMRDPSSLMGMTSLTPGQAERDLQFERVKTHGPVAANIALWFAMLSPLIGLIIGFLGAWFFSWLTS